MYKTGYCSIGFLKSIHGYSIYKEIEMYNVEDIQKIETNHGLMKLSWLMTKWCNLRCSYCYQNDNHESILTPNNKTIIDWSKRLNDIIINNKRNIKLHLIGGEVSYYDLHTVLTNLLSENKYIKSISLITNLTNSLEYYESLIKLCRHYLRNLLITGSLHIEQLTKQQLSNFFIIAKKLDIIVKCVVSEENIDLFKQYKNDLIDLKSNFTVFRYTNTNDIDRNDELNNFVNEMNNLSKYSNYNHGYKLYLKDGTYVNYSSATDLNSLINGNLNNFYCTTGLDNIRLTENGEFINGSCEMAYKENILGTIYDDIKFPKMGIQCKSSKKCTLCFDTNIYSSKLDYKKYLGGRLFNIRSSRLV